MAMALTIYHMIPTSLQGYKDLGGVLVLGGFVQIPGVDSGGEKQRAFNGNLP